MCTQPFPLCSTLWRSGFLAAALFFFLGILHSQISDKLSTVTPGLYRAGEPLTIQVEIVKSASVERIEIAYRPFGQRDFKHSEMSITNNTASVVIPSTDLAPPFLEYYLILYTKDTRTSETYPMENAELNPLKVSLVETEHHHAITILTPDPNERIKQGDILISFSLLQPDTTIDRQKIRILLDGADVSSRFVISEDIYVLQPDNASVSLDKGIHNISVELRNTEGKVVSTDGWSFTVVGVEETGPATALVNQWVYGYSAQLETRNEKIDVTSTPYNRATVTAVSTYGQYRFNGRLYVTNEEASDRQPQNRFFIGAESPWAKAGYGDNYPAFPSLIMNGRRVRGLTGDLTLGAFNLTVAKGEITRQIESIIGKTFSQDSLTSEQQKNPSGIFGVYDSTTAPPTWAIYKNLGVFSRDLFVIRPSFGKESGSHFGFSYLKSKDDITSIRYGIKPQENLVLGTDLLVALNNHNVELTGQGAFSATNRDITNGTFSDAQINSIFKDPDYNNSDRNDIRHARDILSHFITVNENLVPLSLKKLSTFAYEGGLSLNYFNNNFRFVYLRHGNDYASFGQTFIRQDVKGFNVSDRQALVERQVFLSGGIERLQDNTADTKAATTTYTTVNTAVSYFPQRDFPNVTVAYLHAGNANGIKNTPPQHIDSLYAIDDNTNRILIQLGYGFSYWTRHNASLSFSTSDRDDQSPYNLDTRSTSFTLTDVMTYEIPLQTVFSLSVNANTFATAGTGADTKVNYTTLYGNAQYRLADEKLRLTATLSPTFGDLARTLAEFGTQYFFMKNLSALTQLDLYFNKNVGNNTIWSLILRLDM